MNDQYIIEHMDVSLFMKYGPKMPLQYLDGGTKKNMKRTIVMEVRSNIHKTKSAEFTVTGGLDKEVLDTFRSLFTDGGSYNFVPWFTVAPGI